MYYAQAILLRIPYFESTISAAWATSVEGNEKNRKHLIQKVMSLYKIPMDQLLAPAEGSNLK